MGRAQNHKFKLKTKPYGTCRGYYYFAHAVQYNILFKNEQRSKDAAAQKRPNTSGVGKINNYYEDIYIPPYNNTD